MRFHTLLCTGLLLSAPLVAHAASFTDVPSSHPAYSAIEYLKTKGVLQGYTDGSFKPEAPVNRAEALKIIAAPHVSNDTLATIKTSVFMDVPTGAWFLPYVEVARMTLKIIDGPPDATEFHPTRTVNKAEFLKMLLIAEKIDAATAFGEIRSGLSTDVSNPDEWLYAPMRYAVASSMTMVTEKGLLNPGQELTRAQVALLLYRLDTFEKGQRTQALVTEADTDIKNVLLFLESKDTTNARYAATRAMVAARGALVGAPNEPIVKGEVKIAEGFDLLVQSYEAGMEGKLEQAISLSGQAWDKSTKAMAFNPGLKTVAEKLQAIAKSLADEARAMQGQ